MKLGSDILDEKNIEKLQLISKVRSQLSLEGILRPFQVPCITKKVKSTYLDHPFLNCNAPSLGIKTFYFVCLLSNRI